MPAAAYSSSEEPARRPAQPDGWRPRPRRTWQRHRFPSSNCAGRKDQAPVPDAMNGNMLGAQQSGTGASCSRRWISPPQRRPRNFPCDSILVLSFRLRFFPRPVAMDSRNRAMQPRRSVPSPSGERPCRLSMFESSVRMASSARRETRPARPLRRRVAETSDAGAIPHHSRKGHRAGLLRQPAEQQEGGHVPLRLLQSPACSSRAGSSSRAPAGPASSSPWPRRTSARKRTTATAWSARRFSASVAARTSGTCSTTDRRRPAAAIA